MVKTIADAIRHVNITPEQLGMATLIEKLPRAEHIVAVVIHSNKKRTVTEVGKPKNI